MFDWEFWLDGAEDDKISDIIDYTDADEAVKVALGRIGAQWGLSCENVSDLIDAISSITWKHTGGFVYLPSVEDEQQDGTNMHETAQAP